MKFGNRIIRLESCESTNDIASDLARQGCEHGTTVITDLQTKGKGRLGRSWQSFSGNLAMSLVVRPNQLPTKHATRLVMLSAHAVSSALRDHGVRAFIKWPNDILIKADDSKLVEKLGPLRKLGGILLEMRNSDDLVEAAIIGIGLNLRKPALEEENRVIPQMGFVNLDAQEFAHHLLSCLERDLARPEDDAFFSEILSKIKENLAFQNENVVVDKGSEIVSGKVLGLASDGALLIENVQGHIERVYFGDLSLSGV
jgi:BirA family biotin operon repressor/biotin-[acetyl-CoA-carboxylase] ligase